MRAIVVGFSLALTLSATAHASPGRVGLAEAWAVGFPEGKPTFDRPTATVLSLGLVGQLAGPVGYLAEVGMFTPNAAFTPAPRAAAGISYRPLDQLILSLGALYQFNPNYGKGSSNLLGIWLGIGMPITKEIMFVVAPGINKILESYWTTSFVAKVSFVLPG